MLMGFKTWRSTFWTSRQHCYHMLSYMCYRCSNFWLIDVDNWWSLWLIIPYGLPLTSFEPLPWKHLETNWNFKGPYQRLPDYQWIFWPPSILTFHGPPKESPWSLGSNTKGQMSFVICLSLHQSLCINLYVYMQIKHEFLLFFSLPLPLPPSPSLCSFSLLISCKLQTSICYVHVITLKKKQNMFLFA